jgi:hypothetical protein
LFLRRITMAGETIDQGFVQQYQNTMRILSQQKTSRLEGTTISPVTQQGEYLYWERIGSSEAVDLVTRHADTPNIEGDMSRRRSTAAPKVWATLLDSMDQVRMLVDPKAYYNQVARMALNRAKDKIIIAALGGSAWAGKSGTTEVALPSAQKIASGAVGLTLSKVLNAKELLDIAEVDEDMPRFMVVSTQQITNMLNTTEVKSADYNSVKALVQGTIDTFLGFKWIRTQLLTVTSSVRYCYAYAKGAIGMGVLEEFYSKIDQRSDKNYAWQIYDRWDMGATRVEEEQVVEIACTET